MEHASKGSSVVRMDIARNAAQTPNAQVGAVVTVDVIIVAPIQNAKTESLVL
jgi:hypothetical protein